MTIEEKARAYDEALEKAKEWMDEREQMIYPREIVENVFPQLAKSEDERIRKFLVNEVLGHIGMLDLERDRVVNNTKNELWKKALAYLEKQKEQKPAEWSEEDENKLSQVMEALLADKTVALRDYPHCKALHKAYDELLTWLKSLRPQPHWKPSEEQMNALYNIIYPCDYVDKGILESLYNDLKKL